jgi:hypothetical protein
MSFIAIFISLVVIIGAALVVLAAVVGYGCYSLFREFLLKRQAGWTPKTRKGRLRLAASLGSAKLNSRLVIFFGNATFSIS